MRDSSSNPWLKVCWLTIAIGSVLAFMPSAFSSEDKGFQPPTNKACSQGLPTKQEEFVPVEIGDLGDRKNSSVSVLELTQRIPPKAKKAFEQGIKALRHNRLEEGQGFLLKALTVEPKYFQASTLLAALLFNVKEYSASQMYAERARTIDPDYPAALEILGAIDVLDRRWPQGITELTEVVRYSPFRKSAHYYLGVALSHLGQCEEGFRHLETAAYLSAQPSTFRCRSLIPERSPTLPAPLWRPGR